eukprot:344949-Amphidinium_carterae.1
MLDAFLNPTQVGSMVGCNPSNARISASSKFRVFRLHIVRCGLTICHTSSSHQFCSKASKQIPMSLLRQLRTFATKERVGRTKTGNEDAQLPSWNSNI